jgi:hypothetical protein
MARSHVLMVSWIAGVACGTAPPPATPTPLAPAPLASVPAASYPLPTLDLPADRLHERVDGAAELLLRAGCRRLLYWRIENPPADLELYAFAEAQAAKDALARDAGPERSRPIPGEEGWAGPQCLFFRRGTSYVRLIADQNATVEVLTAEAERLDHALLEGSLRP